MHTIEKKKLHPVFNGMYNITQQLGSGNTSKVYLGEAVDPTVQPSRVAIKILKQDYITKSKDNLESFRQEILILKRLNHDNIVKLLGYGDDGLIIKPSGRHLENLVFVVMEYIESHLLFDVCKSSGAMGENIGRYFAHQMIDAMEYMTQQNVAHRDIKLENILFDADANVKIADFGFACQKQIDVRKSYRGTFTYMAPEIKEQKQYSGPKVDIFSFAVTLFVVTHGIFPFKEARPEEYFYNLLMTRQHDLYFKKVSGNNLSDEFKDFILSLLSYNPDERLTIQQIRNHPWMLKTFDQEACRQEMLVKLSQTLSSEKVEKTPRGVHTDRPNTSCGVRK